MMHTRRGRSVLTDQDRLQPALLDRLTDLEPARCSEAASAIYVTETRLRAALLRDLGWLLNACDASSHIDFDDLPLARQSVLNYGMPSLAGRLLSELNWRQLEGQLRQAVLTFEPRILPDSLTVRLVPLADSLGQHNTLQFEIRCQYWSMPYPLEMLLKTSLDLETGQVHLSDLKN